MTSKKFLSKN